MKRKVLVVEDEEIIASFLAKELTFEDYEVVQAFDGVQAVELFEEEKDFDAVILDWMLPKLDGLGVLRKMKKIAPQIPVIFLTARNYVGDKVAGLDAGADDYLTKPFETEELLARLRLLFRRREHPQLYQFDKVKLDVLAHRVLFDGKEVNLTQREYALLLYFFEHQGQALSRDDLLDDVWGMNFAGQINTVDTYVRYLRNKLGKNIVETVRGMGYRLNKNEKKTDQ